MSDVDVDVDMSNEDANSALRARSEWQNGTQLEPTKCTNTLGISNEPIINPIAVNITPWKLSFI